MVRKANTKKTKFKNILNISRDVGLGLKLSVETCGFLCGYEKEHRGNVFMRA